MYMGKLTFKGYQFGGVRGHLQGVTVREQGLLRPRTQRAGKAFWNREGSQCAGKDFVNPESAGEAFLDPESPPSVARLAAAIVVLVLRIGSEVRNRVGSQCAGHAFWDPESAGEILLRPSSRSARRRLSASSRRPS